MKSELADFLNASTTIERAERSITVSPDLWKPVNFNGVPYGETVVIEEKAEPSLIGMTVTIVKPENWDLEVERVGYKGTVTEHLGDNFFKVTFVDGVSIDYWNEEITLF